MTQVTKRVGGTLVTTDDANDPKPLDQMAQLAGVPVTPTTPVGAAAVGANPDQAKMAATPAAKGPVIEEALKPADDLATAQRTQAPKPPVAPGAPEQQAADKAAQLQSLGSLTTRVQALISTQVSQQQAATTSLNTAKMATVPPESQATWTQLMSAVASNPADQKALAAASNFYVQKGMGTLASFNPQEWLASARDSLGAQKDAQVTTQGTLAEVVTDPTEQANLKAVFGDAWQTMTPAQLAQGVEDKRQAEYTRIQGIRAQLATAEGSQRTELLQELDAAGQAGVAGVDQQVADLSKQIAAGDTVKGLKKANGEDYTVEELLKDGEISNLVNRMMDDPTVSDQVAKSGPQGAALVEWVKANAASLGALTQKAVETQGQVRTADALKQQAATVAPGVVLSSKLMSLISPNWNTIGAQDNITTGFYQLLKDPNVSATDKVTMASEIEKLAQTDPDTYDKLAKLDAAGVQTAANYAKQVDADPSGMLSALTGVQQGGAGFIMDKAAQTAITKYSAVVSDFTKAGVRSDVMLDPVLIKGVQSGQITGASAASLAAHPERLQAYKDWSAHTADVDAAYKAKDIGKMLELVAGPGVTAKNVLDEEADLVRMAKLDPGDKDVQARLASLRSLDRDGNGKLDDHDAAMWYNDSTGYTGYNPGQTTISLASIIQGGAPVTTGIKDRLAATVPVKQSAYMDAISGILSDGYVTSDEMIKLEDTNPSVAARLRAEPADWQKANHVVSVADVDSSRSKTRLNDAYGATSKLISGHAVADGTPSQDAMTAVSSGNFDSIGGLGKDPGPAIAKGNALLTLLNQTKTDARTSEEKQATQYYIDKYLTPYLARLNGDAKKSYQAVLDKDAAARVAAQQQSNAAAKAELNPVTSTVGQSVKTVGTTPISGIQALNPVTGIKAGSNAAASILGIKKRW